MKTSCLQSVMAMCKLPDHNLKAGEDFNHLNSLFYKKNKNSPWKLKELGQNEWANLVSELKLDFRLSNSQVSGFSTTWTI